MSAFRYREMPSWPPLAWLAVCDAPHAEPLVVHGARVETRDDWFCEAVWDGDFAAGDFDRNDRVFGSGARARDGAIRFVSAGVPFDRLHHVEHAGRTFVSNSLTALLAAAGLEIDPTHPSYVKDFNATKRGYREHRQRVPTDAAPVALTYYDDLVWADGELRLSAKAADPAELGSYAAYRSFLDGAVSRLFANARSPDRAYRYEPIGALSRGMDSGASMAIAASHGLREAFTFRRARRGIADSGHATARALGLAIREYGRDDWRREALPEVPFILGDARGPDVFYRAAEAELPGRLLVTGYIGGALWTLRKRLDRDDLARRDTSGLSLAEYRLWTGTLHLPIPAIGYRQAPQIDALGRSAEMEPWWVRRQYDKPLARRILLEAGVPEAHIARYNAAATVLWSTERVFLSESSRRDFVAWLERNEARLAATHPGSPLRDLPRDGPRQALGRQLDDLARRAPGPQTRLKAAARWLLRDADPRPVMRYFLPWAMEHGQRRYPAPDLSR